MASSDAARLRERQIFEEYPVKKAVAAMIRQYSARSSAFCIILQILGSSVLLMTPMLLRQSHCVFPYMRFFQASAICLESAVQV